MNFGHDTAPLKAITLEAKYRVYEAFQIHVSIPGCIAFTGKMGDGSQFGPFVLRQE